MLQSSRGPLRIESLTGRALSVPLLEPFVIASGQVETTRAVEVEAHVVWQGKNATGFGEAACLPPVTREDQVDVLREVRRAGASLVNRDIPCDAEGLAEALDGVLSPFPVTRAGIETALLDAMSRIAGAPLRAYLGSDLGARTRTLETDITITIAEPEHMARVALDWYARGFRILKIKVGADLESDLRALTAIGHAVPGVRLRIDANGGLTASQAIFLGRRCESLGLAVECLEQPCATADLDAMAEVATALSTPIVADESVKSYADFLAAVGRGRAAGVNLKIAKMGGVLPAYRIGMEAKARGLKLMAGGMVETRLGMTAGAHLACALGGVDFVDLDTAWLLASDPYQGGYRAEGPRYSMGDTPGLGVTRRPSRPD